MWPSHARQDTIEKQAPKHPAVLCMVRAFMYQHIRHIADMPQADMCRYVMCVVPSDT